MVQIAYLLLAHQNPQRVIAQARHLTQLGDCVAIHYDKAAPASEFALLKDALGNERNIVLLEPRVRCFWGEWSLVQATLNMLAVAFSHFEKATHFYLISGDCMPIKPAGHIHKVLADNDVDYIESVDFFTGGWIKAGIREERLFLWHFFNMRSHYWLFVLSLRVQSLLKIKRHIPDDLTICIGTQWWCLRRDTVGAILEYHKRRPDIMAFFRWTWVPDETFFQTLVRHLVPLSHIRSAPPTLVLFGPYGTPALFYNDHEAFLQQQPEFFARKISPQADHLRARLSQIYTDETRIFETDALGQGKAVFEYTTAQGRRGHRFAPRPWEGGGPHGTPPSPLHVKVIISAKHHIAQRLADRIRDHADIPAVHYVFDEEAVSLPDMGGLEDSLAKRQRYPLAVMRLLGEYWLTSHLIVCLDPSQRDMLQDWYDKEAQTGVFISTLELESPYCDAYLAARAQYAGLLSPRETGEGGPTKEATAIMQMVYHDLLAQSATLRGGAFSRYSVLHEHDTHRRKSSILAKFLGVSSVRASQILRDPFLFQD